MKNYGRAVRKFEAGEGSNSEQSAKLPLEFREIPFESRPDHVEIDLEIPVREDVAHFAGNGPRYVRVLSGEIGKPLFDVSGRLADDLEVSNDGVLRLRVRQGMQRA